MAGSPSGGPLPDARVLSRLLLLEAVFQVSEPHKLAAMLARALQDVPGVASTRVSSEDTPAEGEVVFPLRTPARSFGTVCARLGDPDAFAIYEPYVRNVVAMMGLWLENQRLVGHLEELVQARTRELSRANEELDRRARALEAVTGELVSVSYAVSHELRTPLRAIHGFSDILERTNAGRLDGRALDCLVRIRLASGRMTGLLDDLQRMIHVVCAPLDVEAVDLAEVARDVWVEATRREDAAIVFVAPPTLPVEGDRRLLALALECLLDNARKAVRGRAHARIELGVDADGCVSMSDDGVGFEMAHAARIFEPFWKAHGPDEFPGAGMGLAIAKRVVTRHGGAMWARSAPGAGTVISFTLGAAGAAGERADPTPRP